MSYDENMGIELGVCRSESPPDKLLTENNDYCLCRCRWSRPLEHSAKCWKLASEYFQEYIIRQLAIEKHATGRELNTPREILGLAMRVSTTLKKLTEHLMNASSKELSIRHNPGIYLLMTYINFVIYARKKKVSCETVEELEQVITDTISGIPESALTAVSRAWRRGLQQQIDNDGNYFE
jgi:hypothetical protein